MNNNFTNYQSNSASKASATYNWCVILLIVVLLFTKGKTGVIITIVYPFLGIIILAKYQGLIKFLALSKDNLKPQVAFGFTVPIIILFLWLRRINLYETNAIWCYTLILSSLVIFIIGYLIFDSYTYKKEFYIIFPLIVLFTGLYSYGSLITLNVVFDNSTAKIYTTKVSAKRISYVRNGINHYIKFVNWGPKFISTEIRVNTLAYSRATVNQNVVINCKNGAFGIPYYSFKLL